jgi:hypothetical protein
MHLEAMRYALYRDSIAFLGAGDDIEFRAPQAVAGPQRSS